MHDPSTFDFEELRQARTRVDTLLNGLPSTTAQLGDANEPCESLEDHIRDLREAVEQLLLAEEELHTQSEQLSSSQALLQAERRRYADLFELAVDALVVTDSRGKILETNGAAVRLLGRPARGLKGSLLVSFVDGDQRREFRRMLSRVVASQSPLEETRLRLVPPRGDPFTVTARAAIRPATEEGDVTVLWVVRDLTQHLTMAQALRFMESDLHLLAGLNRLTRLTAEPRSMDEVLEPLLALAATALPDCDMYVAAVDDRSKPRAVAASGPLATALIAAEQALGAGPVTAALREDRPLRLSLGECAGRWPGYAEAGAEFGMHEIFVHPFVTPSGRRGALNVVCTAPTEEHMAGLVTHLADHVATALVNEDLYDTVTTLTGHLHQALESRGVIERAKGVLMGRQGCGDEEAFDILRRASQRTNRKLRDVAADLITHLEQRGGPGQGPNRKPMRPLPPDSTDRAAAREARAWARAEDEKRKAEQADRSTTPPGKDEAAAFHDRARELHERAAELQRRHQHEGPDHTG